MNFLPTVGRRLCGPTNFTAFFRKVGRKRVGNVALFWASGIHFSIMLLHPVDTNQLKNERVFLFPKPSSLHDRFLPGPNSVFKLK